MSYTEREKDAGMTDIQTEVEYDLSLLAARLDVIFPYYAPIMLIATGQDLYIEDRVIANLMADYEGRITFSGVVIRKSYILLARFGYRVEYQRGVPMVCTLCGAARRLSAHERMVARGMVFGDYRT